MYNTYIYTDIYITFGSAFNFALNFFALFSIFVLIEIQIVANEVCHSLSYCYCTMNRLLLKYLLNDPLFCLCFVLAMPVLRNTSNKSARTNTRKFNDRAFSTIFHSIQMSGYVNFCRPLIVLIRTRNSLPEFSIST